MFCILLVLCYACDIILFLNSFVHKKNMKSRWDKYLEGQNSHLKPLSFTKNYLEIALFIFFKLNFQNKKSTVGHKMAAITVEWPNKYYANFYQFSLLKYDLPKTLLLNIITSI